MLFVFEARERGSKHLQSWAPDSQKLPLESASEARTSGEMLVVREMRESTRIDMVESQELRCAILEHIQKVAKLHKRFKSEFPQGWCDVDAPGVARSCDACGWGHQTTYEILKSWPNSPVWLCTKHARWVGVKW